jgi:hypothetical protein
MTEIKEKVGRKNKKSCRKRGRIKPSEVSNFRDTTLCPWACSYRRLELLWRLQLLGHLVQGYAGSVVSRNVGNCSPKDTMSHPRKTETSAAWLQSHEVLHEEL